MFIFPDREDIGNLPRNTKSLVIVLQGIYLPTGRFLVLKMKGCARVAVDGQ